jgi:hypothetical protein
MGKMKKAMEKQAEKQVEKQVEKQKLKLPTTTYENPWLEAAAEAGNPFGKLLKFVKGKWEIGDDEVPLGTEYIAHIDQLARGWVRFEDGKVTDCKIGKVADRIKLPTRDELPDTDPTAWKEKDADDNPRDPWVKQWYLPLIAVETGDFATFVSGSNGGDNAISNLCRVYGHNMRDGLLPIVALKTGSYKHKKYGRIEEPDFPVVGWHGTPRSPIIGNDGDDPKSSPTGDGNLGAGPRTGNAAANADMNDSIPF